jgi:hypothetical protein
MGVMHYSKIVPLFSAGETNLAIMTVNWRRNKILEPNDTHACLTKHMRFKQNVPNWEGSEYKFKLIYGQNWAMSTSLCMQE